MIPIQFIYVGVAINLFCTLWYIKKAVSGNIKPNLISWSLWMIAPFVGFFLQLKAGAGLSSLGVFMAGFGPLLLIIASIFKKNFFWKIQLFDLICGFFSVIAVILYVITHNLGISILFAILSDLLAFIPTFIKSWKYPETESSSSYIGSIINNSLSLLVITNWTFSIYSFSAYLVLANIVELSFLYRKKIFKTI